MTSTSSFSFETQDQHSLGRRLLGDRVGALGLGCMGMSEFYGRADDTQSIRVIHSALDGGVSMLDTADMYGDGHNEELVGRALRTRRDQAFVATKFGIRRDGERRWHDASPDYARSACDASLRRLGVDTIDLYYLHRLDEHTPIEDTIGAMADLVQVGKVRYIGLSEVSAQILRRAHAVHPITAVQSEFSLWTRDVITDGVLAAARELGTSLVPYSPLGRGMLTGEIAALDNLAEDDFRRVLPRFADGNLDTNLALLDSLRAVAEQHDATPGQIALAWVLAQGEDVIPIPGTKRLDYLAQNIAAAAISLSAGQLEALNTAFRPDNVQGARYPAEILPDTRSTRGDTA
ncbi:aryl-alcohol dehydrogenase-like predicted oxidoreductase [Rhodococcus sp. LBL1]|nr:aryl-alcohol dehydrogenase-like predicted oxidoreductase [Rhodococcus sp. LBL1]MDH6685459.1 aryl-alcohol dehydrogenase-like predicted oxidoreductase [Rhodococcus sp. LBL2]